MKKIFARRRRFIWAILLCLSVILFPLLSQAMTVQEVPNSRHMRSRQFPRVINGTFNQ